MRKPFIRLDLSHAAALVGAADVPEEIRKKTRARSEDEQHRFDRGVTSINRPRTTDVRFVLLDYVDAKRVLTESNSLPDATRKFIHDRLEDDECIVVLTSRTADRMIAEGGSQAWALEPRRARSCTYLVCCWNSVGPFARASKGRKHHEAFLVAPIDSVDPAPENSDRYIIRFTRIAKVSIPSAWSGQRNPVAYATTSQVGIDFTKLRFEDVKPSDSTLKGRRDTNGGPSPLSIEDAKLGLALYFNVDPAAIEVVIHG